MNDLQVLPLDVGAAPGLSPLAREILDGTRALPSASPVLDRLHGVTLRGGPAFGDRHWQRELHEDHLRRGADASSFASLERLAAGAACVVTGQQPGLLLGPLYTVYKILGAIALAEALERAQGRPVVPVYWCGADDSDFEEVRRAWSWRAGEGPLRAELDRSLWTAGQRVGSVHGPALVEVEEAALRAIGPHSGAALLEEWAKSLHELDALADRAAGWALRAFAGRGLVVVDARSVRLRTLGGDLFARYRARHREFTVVLRAHAEALRAEGWSTPLDDRALESGLFALEGERRHKLGPDELDALPAGVTTEDLAASVLLRPLWQDALLSPVAAVLGPSELQYHAQIAPLYAALGVGAARPVPRPHLTVWPAQAPWIEPTGGAREWLSGGEAARDALVTSRLPEEWRQALDRLAAQWRSGLDAFGRELADPALADALSATRARLFESVEQLRGRMARRASERDGIDVDLALAWLAVRGVPQERAYSAPHLWWCFGGDTGEALRAIERAYVDAIEHGRAPTFVVRGGRMW